MLLGLSLLLGQKLRSILTSRSTDRGLVYLSGEFWNEYGSPEVRDFPLLGSSPWKLVAIIAIYLYLIAALCSKRPLQRRPPPWRAPVILLLNGSQLGLHGAWILVALFVSPLGQSFANPSPDPKTAEFLFQLRTYTCCTFLLFKIVQLAISVALLSLRRKALLSSLEVFEGVSFPLVIYFNAKFGNFDYLLFISIINALVSFMASAYHTLAAAKILMPFPNREWKRALLILKSIQYASMYFGSFWYAKSSAVPIAIKVLSGAFSSVMNLLVWCALSMSSESPEIT